MNAHLERRLLSREILTLAIAACDRQDAAAIMSAALDDLQAGMPIPAILDARQGAHAWSEVATPYEIECYFYACMSRIDKGAIGLVARKRLMWEIWTSLPLEQRKLFLRRISDNDKQSDR